jgi:hypothetical protein
VISSLGVPPPKTELERILEAANPPLGDRGREPGGLVAAKSAEADVLLLWGRLDIEEVGDCKSRFSRGLDNLKDEDFPFAGGEYPRGAASFIDVMKTERLIKRDDCPFGTECSGSDSDSNVYFRNGNITSEKTKET